MTTKPWLGKSVIIVDDSPSVRVELKAVFEACGMNVVATAEDGVAGIEAFIKHQPELVSLDIIMPEMDGIECYRKLKALAPNFRCVIVSWLAGEVKVQESLQELIPAHLFQMKPVSRYEMEARLEKVYFPPAPVVASKVAAKGPADAEPLPVEVDLEELGIKVS